MTLFFIKIVRNVYIIIRTIKQQDLYNYLFNCLRTLNGILKYHPVTEPNYLISSFTNNIIRFELFHYFYLNVIIFSVCKFLGSFF